MVTLDFFATQTALPAMATDLQTTVSTLQWVISGYMLTMASLFIVGGRIADIFGRRTWYLIGATIFGATSLLGGLAANAGMVITFRILQGAGSAIMIPAALSTVTNAVPPDRVQRSIGIVFGVGAVGQAFGPVIGGALTALLSWRWVLLLNVPITIAVLVLIVTAVQQSRDESAPRRIDWVGAALVTTAVACFTYGIDRTADWGWLSPAALAFIAAGAVGLVLLVVVEARVDHPLIDLSLFRIREFTVTATAAAVGNMTLVAGVFLSMIYLQNVLGFDALQAGFAFLGFSLGVMVANQLAGSLERFMSWRVESLGLAVGGVGVIGMGIADTLAPFLVLSAVGGFGTGLAFALGSVVTQAVVPADEAGEASGIVLTIVVGLGAVAVAAASSLVEPAIGASASRLGTRLDDLFVGFGIWSLAFAPIVAALGRTPTTTPAATTPGSA